MANEVCYATLQFPYDERWSIETYRKVGGYQALVASKYAVTDNAYVGADSAQVTPRVEGAVSGWT